MTYFYDALSKYILENRDTDKIPAVWASLCNIQWVRDDDVVTYSFRTAGGEIADILGEGSYMDWYCSAPVSGVGGIPKEFADHMAAHGWTPREWPVSDADIVINLSDPNAADQIMAAIFKQ